MNDHFLNRVLTETDISAALKYYKIPIMQVEFDNNDVPEALHELIPYAAYWGFQMILSERISLE